MITIRDIAKAAGVSKSTVALALRQDERCAKETIQRILRLSEELGYRPNPLVSANMANMRMGSRRKKVTAILVYFYDCRIGAPYEQVTFKAAKERAEELGFALEPLPYNDPDLNSRRLLQVMRNRNVKGILIRESKEPIDSIDFNWNDFAVATIGFTLQHPRFHRIGYDHVENMRRLFVDLKSRQYKRVGLALRKDFDDRISHFLSASYLGYQHEQHLEDPLPMFSGIEDWSVEGFLKWVEEYSPDVIVTVGTEVPKWLASSNFKVPEELGIVSIWGGDVEQAEKVNYFMISLDKLARIAVDVISDQLNSNLRGIPVERRSILVSSEYCDRGSLRQKGVID